MSGEDMTPPDEIFVPAPTDVEEMGTRDCGGASILATSSLVNPKLRFKILLAIPELRLLHSPLILWLIFVPIPLTLAEIVRLV